MDPSEVVQSAKEAGLGRLAEDIKGLLEGSIRIRSQLSRGRVFPLGASRMGGQPDLPEKTDWPVWKGAPMSFVIQIRLEDAKPFDPTGLLPDSGLLSFFYDSKQETYGASPEDRGGWKVFYFDASASNLKRTAYPDDLSSEARFASCALTFSSELTLPFAPRQIHPDLDWTDDEIHKYEDFRSSFPSKDDYQQMHHRMLGYPEQIQDDMQLQSVLMANGVSSIDDPNAQVLEKRKGDWLLLLQVDSNEQAGMRWASSGMLYYWIERQALADKNFEPTWLVLQSE
jgi:uncharacterized protein YwqG